MVIYGIFVSNKYTYWRLYMKINELISKSEFNALPDHQKREYLLSIINSLTDDEAKELYEAITSLKPIYS